jgi:protein-disulfide isomerase
MSKRSYVLVGALAGLLAAALVGASMLGARDDHRAPAQTVFADDTAAILGGIPQKGRVLGRPDAPVTLVEFADLQCPYCAQWSQQAFAELVRDYVRPGKVRLVFGGVAFLGPDSEQALRFALAAGRQGKLWNVVHLLYAYQGPENSGWVSDQLLRGIGAATPGFSTDEAIDEAASAPVHEEIESVAGEASSLGVNGTPAFAAGRTRGELRLIELRSLDAEGLRPALDALLAK